MAIPTGTSLFHAGWLKLRRNVYLWTIKVFHTHFWVRTLSYPHPFGLRLSTSEHKKPEDNPIFFSFLSQIFHIQIRVPQTLCHPGSMSWHRQKRPGRCKVLLRREAGEENGWEAWEPWWEYWRSSPTQSACCKCLNIGKAIQSDQPVDPALLLLLDHPDHTQVDPHGGSQHGDVGQEVGHRDLVHCFRRVNSEGQIWKSKTNTFHDKIDPS